MYPFYVLDLPHEVTDAEVEARYHALVERFPPDLAPEQFALIREAYEALKTAQLRLRCRLFHPGGDPGDPARGLEVLAGLQPRTRLAPDDLARWLSALD